MFRRALLVLALVLRARPPQAKPATLLLLFLTALWPDAAQARHHPRDLRRRLCRAHAGCRRRSPPRGGQPEYGKPFGAYLASLVVAIAHFASACGNLPSGPRRCAPWKRNSASTRSILVSIWGIESSFGGGEQRWDVFRSLATLAQARFQHPLFHDELLSALKILQDDRIPRREFVGSWAGAMGQAQFLPSSFLKYAVDFDGDGKADIWRSVPDVLASIANYLQKSGWQTAPALGFRGRGAAGFRLPPQPRHVRRLDARGTTPRRWRRLAWHAATPFCFFRAAPAGPAFLVTDNFIVLKRFNNSDAYALAVGELSDRLRGDPRSGQPGRPTISSPRASSASRSSAGSPISATRSQDFEGHFDFDLRDAVREQQERFGMVADGYPGRAFLDRIGPERRERHPTVARTIRAGALAGLARLRAWHTCSASSRAISRM